MTKSKRTLLWRISSPNLRFDSFLFGTMHVRDPRIFAFFEQCQTYILQCDVYAAEMDLGEAQRDGQPSDFALPAGQSLLDYVSLKKFKKAQKQVLKSFDIDISRMTGVHPMFLTNLIAESLLNSTQSEALDQAMWRWAENQDLEMTGVESYADQLNTFRSLDIGYQVKQFLSISRQPYKIRKQTTDMLEMYLQMDIQKLYKSSKKGLGKLRKELLHIRNKTMATNIQYLVTKQPTFIALGAGHLAGEKGLIPRLKKKGFSLRPIALNNG